MNRNTIPMDYRNENLKYLMKKLELHLLTTDEAQELIQLLEDEKQESIKYGDKKYELILSGLLDVLNKYVAGEINLYESDISVKVSNV